MLCLEDDILKWGSIREEGIIGEIFHKHFGKCWIASQLSYVLVPFSLWIDFCSYRGAENEHLLHEYYLYDHSTWVLVHDWDFFLCQALYKQNKVMVPVPKKSRYLDQGIKRQQMEIDRPVGGARKEWDNICQHDRQWSQYSSSLALLFSGHQKDWYIDTSIYHLCQKLSFPDTFSQTFRQPIREQKQYHVIFLPTHKLWITVTVDAHNLRTIHRLKCLCKIFVWFYRTWRPGMKAV